MSILLAAHLSRTASRTLLVTVAGSALMASAGPQMAGLVTSPVLAQFAALTLLPLALAAISVRAAEDDTAPTAASPSSPTPGEGPRLGRRAESIASR